MDFVWILFGFCLSFVLVVFSYCCIVCYFMLIFELFIFAVGGWWLMGGF